MKRKSGKVSDFLVWLSIGNSIYNYNHLFCCAKAAFSVCLSGQWAQIVFFGRQSYTSRMWVCQMTRILSAIIFSYISDSGCSVYPVSSFRSSPRRAQDADNFFWMSVYVTILSVPWAALRIIHHFPYNSKVFWLGRSLGRYLGRSYQDRTKLQK